MTSQSDDLQSLLRRVAEGDEEAVGKLLESERGAIHRMIGLRLDRAIGTRVDASDIVQETMIEAARRIRDYAAEPKLPFGVWLRHLAKDHVIDAHRKHRGAKRRSVDRERSLADPAYSGQSTVDLAARLQAQGLTPSTEAMRRELIARFDSALEELGEDDREVVLMRYFEHRSNQEVAAELGISEPAAGMRHLRAVRRLRALLAEPPRDGGD